MESFVELLNTYDCVAVCLYKLHKKKEKGFSPKTFIFDDERVVNKQLGLVLLQRTSQYFKLLKKIQKSVKSLAIGVIKDQKKVRDGDTPLKMFQRCCIFDFSVSDKSSDMEAIMAKIDQHTKFSKDINADLIDIMLHTWKAKDKCKEFVAKRLSKKGFTSVTEFIPKELQDKETELPKYLRLNRHVCNDESYVEDQLLQTFQEVNSLDELSGESFYQNPQFCRDPIVPGLWAIPFDTPTHRFDIVKQGQVLVMDKSSTLPPFILTNMLKKLKLDPKKISFDIIDACASPGNKTSFLAEYLLGGKNCNMYAFEIDKKRYHTLEKRLRNLNVQNAKTFHQDFFKVNPMEYQNVRAIMLDPSCSGSGIVRRQNYVKSGDQTHRIKKLSDFQQMLLKHCMRFPNCQVIMYSTCSIHTLENEHVINTVLNERSGWKLHKIMRNSWKTRGDTSIFKDGDHCIRCDPAIHKTGGFFVACLVRDNSAKPEKKRKRSNSKNEPSKKRRVKMGS